MPPAPQPVQETIIWRGSPSQAKHAGIYILCLLFCWLVVPVFVALYYFILNRSTKYEVTTERVRLISGIFSRRIDEVELYRVKDYALEQPFFLRLFGCSNFILNTSDVRTPLVVMEAIHDAESLRDEVRKHVEHLRQTKRVREMDIGEL